MFRVGNTTIQKIHETDLNGFTLTQLLPAMDGLLQARHPDWFPNGTTEGERALLSVHSWVLRHEGLIILIDTGAGNDKARPQQTVLDHLSNPFLERLEAAGVVPEMVDYVLHTHVHSDHVGWNTIYAQEQWKPTFPNAVHICSRLEWDYGAALADGDERGISLARAKAGFGEPVRIPVSGTFDDSMRPLQSSAQIQLIAVDGQEVLPGLRFLSTPGHSIDHAAIELRSAGDRAIFGGDVLHHPVELYDTDLVSAFCEFPEPARRSRLQLLEMAASSNALYFSAHFPLTSAGWITKRSDGYHWEFAQ
jgi:glyoxylase-like metal-dependent hydrolase (beta-lactamase superfamily II)